MRTNRQIYRAVTEQVSRHLDDPSAASHSGPLRELLTDDPEACEHYLDWITTEAHLHRLLGGEIPSIPGLPATIPAEVRSRRRWPWRRLAAGVLLAAGLSLGFLLARHVGRAGHTGAYVARLKSTVDSHWSGDPPPLNEPLRQGPLVLTAGLAEIELFDGALAVLQGPARVVLQSPSRLVLNGGRLTAVVPPRARGFTVETPSATVVDHGTEVGVFVDERQTTWTRLFEGQVTVTAKVAGGRSRRLASSQTVRVGRGDATVEPVAGAPLGFPQPGRWVDPKIDGGFEPGDPIVSEGVPGRVGLWSGDDCRIVGPDQGIEPHGGRGMLRFVATTAPKDTPRTVTAASQQWRILDLRPLRTQVRAGRVTVEASAYFNRVAVTARDQDVQQGLAIHAFRGKPADVRRLWPHRSRHRIRCLEAETRTDNDPATWEPVELTFPVPPASDLLMIELRTALDPTAGGPIVQRFPGHYADDVRIRLRIGPLPGD